MAGGAVDPDRFDEWAQRVSDAYPDIGRDGVAGVYDYTTENYQGVNPYLREVDPLSPEQQSILGADSINNMTDDQRAAWEERISSTDDGLSSLPPIVKTPVTRYRPRGEDCTRPTISWLSWTSAAPSPIRPT
jgi:hypothetical protein